MNLKRALKRVRKYNEQGISCSLAYFAVTNKSNRLVEKEVSRYIQLLKGISEEKVDSDVTVKLQQFGIYLDESVAYNAIERIVKEAESYRNFVWIDMYLPDTVDVTIKIFRQLREKYNNVGICLQAYLERTENDLHEILKDRHPLRLVKGFYKEYDFDRWEDVTENYERMLSYMLTNSDRPAVATHDPELIKKAKRIIRESKSDSSEFQFFTKVCDDVALELVNEGYKVRVYIAYGNFWKFLIREIKTFDLWQNFKRFIKYIWILLFARNKVEQK